MTAEVLMVAVPTRLLYFLIIKLVEVNYAKLGIKYAVIMLN